MRYPLFSETPICILEEFRLLGLRCRVRRYGLKDVRAWELVSQFRV